jgi:hypothetical protein
MSSYTKYINQFYPQPVPWVPEIFDARVQALMEDPSLTNMDLTVLRLHSSQAREKNDARYTLKFLKLLLPELFDEKLIAEIAKEVAVEIGPSGYDIALDLGLPWTFDFKIKRNFPLE